MVRAIFSTRQLREVREVTLCQVVGLVAVMPLVRKDHGHVGAISRLNHLLVTLRAARLDHSSDPRFLGSLDRVRKRQESI